MPPRTRRRRVRARSRTRRSFLPSAEDLSPPPPPGPGPPRSRRRRQRRAAASAEEEEAAATRIQATFKGKKARAEFAASRESSPEGGGLSRRRLLRRRRRRAGRSRREPSRGFPRFGGGDVRRRRPLVGFGLAVGGVRGDGDRLARPRGALGAPPRARSPARVQDHDRRGRVVRVRSRGVPRVESRRRLGGSRRVEFLRRNRREFSRAHVLERAARDPTPSRRG